MTKNIPDELKRGALLHFENGVPIDDLALRRESRDRLARVKHVYWQWIKNPWLDTYQMFRQLSKGKYSDASYEINVSHKDQLLFEYVRESVSIMSRKEAQMKVQAAAEKAIRIGMETDNVNALTRGGKLLFEVAGLDKPEETKEDISKVSFLPSVVVTNIKDVDPDKTNIDDEETRRIAAKYGAYVDEKRIMVEQEVATMEARRVKSEEF